ncbi:hypothetical protein COZ82_03890 [Candidatus Kaiserbacteria bacterium CG_4_8_14_3_um_filter_38_9]|uniref:Laccase domain-containing protein n=1 Tax=Candidatus Kaiserbacteria bacterium CG_4_8_14_3_um_filter_38_9 TaxID=1974599 RepID=A0A2M7IMU5_9BACT|nr:MAG: hypothetical protein COZ82_03890 [Candidatus Kaiserbacteria bacterium CG_4_8_14_3_um_filter_38_9]
MEKIMAIISKTSFGESVRITTWGNQPRFNKFDPFEVGKHTRSTKVGLIIAPSTSAGEGFGRIRKNGIGGSVIRAEGILLNSAGMAGIIQTADCPVIVIRNPKNGKVMMTHAGRAALTPGRMPNGTPHNIVSKVYQMVLGDSNPAYLQTHITACICGKCFVHDFHGSEEYIKSFDKFGPTVFTNRARGELDMKAVIVKQLTGFGVMRENITWDSKCTKETSGLSSLRKGSSSRNTIVVERLS